MRPERFPLWVKVLILQAAFLLLHFLYDWLPGPLTAIFSGTNESIYQHMKAAFFAYVLVSLIEYAVFAKRLERRAHFFHVRGLTAVLFPLLVIPWYYTSAAYFVKIETVFLEILFANAATLLNSISGVLIEQHLEKVVFGRGLKWCSAALFIITLSEFIIFTYRLPWLDVFANPPGW